MADRPSPLSQLVQASKLSRQRCEDQEKAHLMATVNSGSIDEAGRSPEVYNAERAWEDALQDYSFQACRVLEAGTVVATSMDEIEALLEILGRVVPPHGCLSVVIKGPEPQGNVVDPLVAQMRATLEAEGFTSGNGNNYFFLQPLLLAAQQPAPAEQKAPVQQPAGGRTSLRRTKRRL